MAPMASSSSDEVMNLPRVPRVRRGAAKADPPGRGSEQSSARNTKSKEQPLGNSTRKSRDLPSRERGKRNRVTESIHSDDDENEDEERGEEEEEDEEDESEEIPPMRRTKRQPRRTLHGRKIVVDEDDDDDDGDDDGSGSGGGGGGSGGNVDDDDQLDEEAKEEDSESDSQTPPPAKKKTKRVKDVSSDSNSKEDEEADEESDGLKKMTAGQEKILAQLEEDEEMDDGSDQLDSDDFDELDKHTTKKTERLTRRQRAMQGESVKLEFTKLESPKSKKVAPPEEEWSNDEEAELKKQQRARLRQMIHEKRNKEKRAAMVDKVLRGVTSKRKKLTMANEDRVAKVGTRLSRNEMREGCIRFVSNPDGISLSIPKDEDAPLYLQSSTKATYPRPCTRDPRTGKRIFADA